MSGKRQLLRRPKFLASQLASGTATDANDTHGVAFNQKDGAKDVWLSAKQKLPKFPFEFFVLGSKSTAIRLLYNVEQCCLKPCEPKSSSFRGTLSFPQICVLKVVLSQWLVTHVIRHG